MCLQGGARGVIAFLLLLGCILESAPAGIRQGEGCTFAVALPELEGPVTLGIFSRDGSLVRLLYRDAAVESIPSGLNGLLMTWDGMTDQGQAAQPGTYLARGIVHGPLDSSVVPVTLANSTPWENTPNLRPTSFATNSNCFPYPSNILRVQAANDVLYGKPPVVVLSAQMNDRQWVLLANGLPVEQLPRAGTDGDMVTMALGKWPGTALLTEHARQGSLQWTVAGLDRLVPIEAGTLDIPSRAFHPVEESKDSEP